MQDFFFAFIGKFSYIGLFGILIAAGLGIPLPEDIPLIAAGWLVHKGQANLYGMMVTGLLGVMVGDSLLFFMGKRYGDHVFEHKWLRKIAKPWLMEKARLKFEQHGAKILFAARFMPGLRSVLFLTAGAFKVPYWKFASIDGFAALISVPLWVWAGWKFSGRIEEFIGEAKMATMIVGGVLVLCLVGWGIYEYRHNLSKRAAARIEAEVHEKEVALAERRSSSGLLGIERNTDTSKSRKVETGSAGGS